MAATPTQLSVVHLLAPAPFGGLESVVETLAAGQAATGDAVCVAAVLSDGDGSGHPFVVAARRRGLDVEVLRIGVREYLRERREVGALLRARGAHVLHTHGYRPDVVDAPVARGMGVAAVTTVHGYTGGGGLKGRLYEWLQTRSYRSSAAVLAVSAKLRGELVAAGVPAERVHTVPNAWAPSGAALSRLEARRALGIRADARVVGWVGRLSTEKAPDVALRVLAATRDASVTLSLVGTGPMDEEVTARAVSLGITDRVRRHGYVASVGRHLAAFDALLITSWTEGTPVTLLEAMGAGVPVVTTAVGGIPDVVGPDEACLAPAGDVAALAAAVDDVVADALGAAERAAAARARLEMAFAVGPWVERHRDIYRSVSRGAAVGASA
ncbi:MAG: glycosyltransferase family 4 protein [Gemmatimonadota bacterium]